MFWWQDWVKKMCLVNGRVKEKTAGIIIINWLETSVGYYGNPDDELLLGGM